MGLEIGAGRGGGGLGGHGWFLGCGVVLLTGSNVRTPKFLF